MYFEGLRLDSFILLRLNKTFVLIKRKSKQITSRSKTKVFRPETFMRKGRETVC